MLLFPVAFRPLRAATLLYALRAIVGPLWLFLHHEPLGAEPPLSRPPFSTSISTLADRWWRLCRPATPPRLATGLRFGHEAFLRFCLRGFGASSVDLRALSDPFWQCFLHPGRRHPSPHLRGSTSQRPADQPLRRNVHGTAAVVRAIGDWLPRVCGTSAGASPWHPAPLLSSSSVSRRPPVWPYAPTRLVGYTTCIRMWSGVTVRSWYLVLCPDLLF